MNSKIKLLYIDDELLNLEAFTATFRRQFDIYTTQSTDKAIEILNSEPIEVVLADQRMPEKTGVEFFEGIVQTHPNPIRILLTAFTDINAIVDAINKGQVYRYITKPWSEFDLKLTIENAYQLYLLREQNNKLNLKYKEVFASSTDPIILFDGKGRIIDYNKSTLNLIQDDFLNFSSFSSIISNKSDSENIVKKLEQYGKVDDYECQIKTKNGDIKTCLISGNTITNNYNEIISYQAIIKDITIRTKNNQLLFQKVIETQENERARISRDLHDDIGQSLIAIKFQLEQLKTKHENLFKDDVNDISTNLTKSIGQLRNICYDILPPALAEYGYKYALKQISEKIETPKIKLELNDNVPQLSKLLETAIYRIAQEFINNAIKHAHCSLIKIQISHHQSKLHINLNDNGIGFDESSVEYGLGISNIVSRVKSFNGTLEINSVKNKGTNFNILIPITKKNYNNSTNSVNELA